MRKHSPRVGPAAGTSSPSAPPEVSRRRFLFALSAGSAGAAAAAAAPALAGEAAATAKPSDAATSGYRETEHVRDYYASTRL